MRRKQPIDIESQDLIQAAIQGYESQIAQIQEKIADLRRRLGVKVASAASAVKPPRRGRISAEGRARIAAAQRLRWKRSKAAAKAD